MNRNCGFYVLDPITQIMHLKGLSFFLQLTPWIACRGCVTHECALIWINFDFGAKVQKYENFKLVKSLLQRNTFYTALSDLEARIFQSYQKVQNLSTINLQIHVIVLLSAYANVKQIY